MHITPSFFWLQIGLLEQTNQEPGEQVRELRQKAGVFGGNPTCKTKEIPISETRCDSAVVSAPSVGGPSQVLRRCSRRHSQEKRRRGPAS